MSAPSPQFRRTSGPWTEERLRVVPEMIRVIERLLEEMAGLGYRDRDRFGMHLVLEEVIVNAIKHGNRSDPTKEVRVRWSIGPDRVLVEVEDQGPGFNPGQIADPTMPENLECTGGRGLLLIRCYTNWVQYNDRGNCVTLCKHPSAPLAPGQAG